MPVKGHVMPLLLIPATALPPIAQGWSDHWDPSVQPLVALGLMLALYLWGVLRVNRRRPKSPWPKWRTASLVAAVLVSAYAVSSFLDVYNPVLFWVHMTQHLVLVMVCGFLFAAASPIALAWRATSGRAKRVLGTVLRSFPAQLGGHPAFAFVLYAVAIPVCHLTVFFNWAVLYAPVDDAEHVLFLVVGYLFWRQIVGNDPNRFSLNPPMRAVMLFLALPVDTFVGLTLDQETREIFPALAGVHRDWGPSLVNDLHIGGVIMWVGGDLLMMFALIPVVVGWLRHDERRAKSADRLLDALMPEVGIGAGGRAGQRTAGFALGTYRPRGGRRRADARKVAGPGPSG